MDDKSGMSPEQKRAFLLATVDFFFCPNNGHVIEGLKGDDKVLCSCGKSNPKISEPVPGLAAHVRSFLDRATVDEYIEQETRERARKAARS